MIPKSERDEDKAICEAASTDWREGAVEKWHLYCAATHPDRMAHERVLMRANEHFPYEADVKAAAHCRNRLPLYIADAEEMDRRIEALLEAARRHENGEIRIDAEGKLPPEVSRALDNTAAAVLRLAVKILRGGQ